VTLAESKETAQAKPPKGGQNERMFREGHEGSAGRVKTFQRTGDVKNGTAGL
jgi:hypothetical protein